ncbi:MULTISPECIES: STAS domain-containing protein [Legionella]|uniref:STAS domain-containing protein n=1 Tax=Legionella septentrionalis TaxID=2498109 RepID=A0A3S0WRR1_9GAMM|nr:MULTISPECIES: STAS domain-containing protein [Legionella]MCP0913579.1 STAS domain-containing protein [Legionella sp. 27cVA30]RUQ88232.1 STAS domain-containing protein [Legionella septentrionalis]RUQ97474.1 STAS domain-containing protein [Legionella septentrionalis]RUR09770.1 STAS domain-containing protein [Legionella septentrionalis]RUR15938.1 STAS domain-containing protein [Legionella septentrionalis]
MVQKSLKLSNELTFNTVSLDYKRLVKALHDDKTMDLCLDLHHVTHCDSAGLALLIEATRLARQCNKKLKIEHVPKEIYALAEFCGVEAILA